MSLKVLPSGVNVRKSENDKYSYRALTLENGLRVLLLSDHDARKKEEISNGTITSELPSLSVEDPLNFVDLQVSDGAHHCDAETKSYFVCDNCTEDKKERCHTVDSQEEIFMEFSREEDITSILDENSVQTKRVRLHSEPSLSTQEDFHEGNERRMQSKSLTCILCTKHSGCFRCGREIGIQNLLRPKGVGGQHLRKRFSLSKTERRDLKMAAVSLCVGVGSFMDPHEVPGLAHLLEHMLFMGSAKYPEENDFDSFIQSNGGYDNAYTELENTVYYFEVKPSALKEGMDIFAHFFVSPLLKEESIDRELEAIDSEFKLNLQKDSVRYVQLLAMAAKDHHNVSKFTWGNSETLYFIPKEKGINVICMLKEFWNQHYVAENMTLAVFSTDPLDVIEDWVKCSFKDLPFRSDTPPTLADKHNPLLPFDNPYDMSKFNQLYYVCPVKDGNMIEITWLLPPLLYEYRTKPMNYIAWLLGHEGKGSVLHHLKRRGWALALMAGNGGAGIELNQYCSMFTCTVTLTDEGMDNVFEVATVVFQYLEMLRIQGPNEGIFEEVKKLSDIEFRFQEEEEPVDYVKGLSENMQVYDPENYITGADLLFEYNERFIAYIQDLLIPDKAHFILSSRRFESECTEVEEYFKTKYIVKELPPEWRNAWKSENIGMNAALHFPPKNPMLGSDFSLKSPDVAETKFPVVIHECEQGRLWYKKDNKFRLPKAFILLHLISDVVSSTAKSVVCSSVLVNLVQHNLKEKAYEASLAQLGYYISVSESGLVLQFHGFNEKLKVLCEYVVAALVSLDFTAFEIIKEHVLRSISNSPLRPTRFARELRLEILLSSWHPLAEQYAECEKLCLADLIAFHETLFRQMYLESLCMGNLTASESIAIQSFLYGKLAFAPSVNPVAKRPRVLELPRGSSVIQHDGYDPGNVNSVVTDYYQVGEGKIRDYVLVELLVDMMEEPLFNILRTQQQLGYIVQCCCRNSFGILGWTITVAFETVKYDCEEVHRRILGFIATFRELLLSQTDDEFQGKVLSLITVKRQVDLTLSEEVDRCWAEILEQTYVFDRSEQEVTFLQMATQDDVVALLDCSAIDTPHHLSVQIVGVHSEGNIPKRSTGQEDDDVGCDSNDEDEVCEISSDESGSDHEGDIPNPRTPSGVDNLIWKPRAVASELYDNKIEEIKHFKSQFSYFNKAKIL